MIIPTAAELYPSVNPDNLRCDRDHSYKVGLFRTEDGNEHRLYCPICSEHNYARYRWLSPWLLRPLAISLIILLALLSPISTSAAGPENGIYYATFELSSDDGCSQSSLLVEMDEHIAKMTLFLEGCTGVAFTGTALFANIEVTKTSLSIHSIVVFQDGNRSYRAAIAITTTLIRFASQQLPNGDIISSAQVQVSVSLVLAIVPRTLLFTELSGDGTISYQYVTGNPLPE